MNRSFNEKYNILYFKPSVLKEIYPKGIEKCSILIPMQVYRVSVPEKQEKKLDIFQEIILKLLKIKNMKSEEIAEKLCIENELVNYIIKDLTNKGYLRGKILTEYGEKSIEDSVDIFEYKEGYVFYNYLTEVYEDIVISEEDFFQTTVFKREKDYIEFNVEEDISKDIKRQRGYIVNELTKKSMEIKEISPMEVLSIGRRFAQRPNISVVVDKHRITESIEKKEEKNKTYFKNAGNPYIMNNLGETVYVVTDIFLPKDFKAIKNDDIKVMYPFFGGISSILQKGIIKVKDLPENRNIREQINNLKEKVFSKSIENKGKDNEKNNEIIEKIFSENIKNYEDINLVLIRLISNYLEIIKYSRNIGANWDKLQQVLQDGILELYNLNIEIYCELAQRYDYFRDNELCSQSSINGNIIATISEKIGFDKKRNVIKRYFSIPKGKINISGDVELKSIFAYNLLSANNFDRSHPMYQLGAKKSNFIENIILLTGLRNISIHSTEAIDTIDEVESLILDTFITLEILFEDLKFNKKELENLKANDQEQDSKNIRDEILFKRESERLYLDIERKYREFTDLLIENKDLLHIIAEVEAEKQLKGDFYPAKVSKVFENIFKKLLENKNLDEIIIDDEKELLEFLEKEGFEIERRPYYNTLRIQRVLSYGFKQATLSSLLYSYVLYLKQNINKEIEGFLVLKKNFKNLFYLTKEIEKLRGHNAKIPFESVEMTYLKNNFEAGLEVFLNLIEINLKINL